MTYSIDVASDLRIKGRPKVWRYSVIAEESEIFRSSLVSIHAGTESAARWLGSLVQRALEGGLEPRRLRERVLPELVWSGDLNDDCGARLGDWFAHAEHMEGPKRGGHWWCAIGTPQPDEWLFTSSSLDAAIKSGSAARWLLELVLFVAAQDIRLPSTGD